MTEGLAIRTSADGAARRLRLRVRGTVQGVGFRPHVHGLAHAHGLSGFVLNDGDGVLIEVEGADPDALVQALRQGLPPLAAIDSLEAQDIAPVGGNGFAILVSDAHGRGARIPADAALCEACERDLFDPASRFYHYPFVTCTHCGPRYTITRGLPYDRPQTALAPFALCPDCARDYADPANRRHHAEALACPVCGPRLSHDVGRIMAVIDAGGIVAVKGIGGFHLMADARNEAAVSLLRSRKKRDFKPFAVMVANPASVPLVAQASEREMDLLTSRARPIVVLAAKGGLAPSVAPRLNALGVMLPYAPLHHLMMAWGRDEARRHEANPRVLVATSANLAGDPLITGDGEAREKLADIADLVVTHDRAIVTRADDSVAAVAGGKTIFYRRARGYAPDPIDLGADGPPVLALGAHLKAAVTLTRGREAFVSQHVGSLTNAPTIAFYEETLAHLKALTGVAPEAVACDLHPDLFTTRLAESLGLPVIRVQHHAAHVAAVAAEHRLDGVTGLALDGYGYGDDGRPWGGEAIRLDGAVHRRIGHLAPLGLPGGDKASRQPWRMALAALHKMGRLDRLERLPPEAPALARLLPGMAQAMTLASTSSLGRVFDAASALLGICSHQDYEGQAAMEMESLVRTPRPVEDGYAIRDGVLDLLPLLAVLADPALDARTGAEIFHGTLARALADWAAEVSGGQGPVALAGGCMMNRVLAESVPARLQQLGLEGVLPVRLPPNDGGLSLGQAHVARRIISGGK